jgi:hypothetical protein
LPTLTPTSPKAMVARKPLHIITTSFLECGDVLVNFSDGSSAIYEAEELEKLRPVPKQTMPACAASTPGSAATDDSPAYAEVA